MRSQFVQLAKNSIIYSIGALSTKALGFVLLPIYTSKLSVPDYGMLAILEVSAQFVTAVFGLNLYRALVRWYWDPEYRDKQKAVFFTLLSFLILFVVLLEIAGYLIAPAAGGLLFGGTNNTYVLRLMLVSAGLEIIFQIPLTLMRVQEKPILYSVSNGIKLLVSGSMTIYFILFLAKKVDGIYEAQIIGAVFFLLLISPYIIKNIQASFLGSTLKEMFRFSFPLVFASISGLLLTIADRFFLKFMAGLSDVGVYSLGFKIGNSLKLFLVQSVLLAVSPIIFKMMDHPENKKFYARLMSVLGLLVMSFAVVLSVFGHELTALLARKPDYQSAEYIISIISFGVFFGMLKETALTGINIQKKTKILALIVLTAAFLNLVLNYILISWFQSIGAATATLITQIYLFLQVYYIAQKIYPIPYALKKIAILISMAVLTVVVGFLMNDMPFVVRLIFKGLLLSGFFISLYFFNVFNKDELNKVLSTVKKKGGF